MGRHVMTEMPPSEWKVGKKAYQYWGISDYYPRILGEVRFNIDGRAYWRVYVPRDVQVQGSNHDFINGYAENATHAQEVVEYLAAQFQKVHVPRRRTGVGKEEHLYESKRS